jgi:hypothetical protein
MTKVLPLFELPIGATVERGNVNAKAELFFCYEKGGKKPVVNIFALGLEWITYLSVRVEMIYNLRIVFVIA